MLLARRREVPQPCVKVPGADFWLHHGLVQPVAKGCSRCRYILTEKKKKKNQFHTLIIVFLKRRNESSTFIYQIPVSTFNHVATAGAVFDSWSKSVFPIFFLNLCYVCLCFVLSLTNVAPIYIANIL